MFRRERRQETPATEMSTSVVLSSGHLNEYPSVRVERIAIVVALHIGQIVGECQDLVFLVPHCSSHCRGNELHEYGKHGP